MTNLDLPPISFARYLDLLKRRKWQVVPISLLGMVIGALVAAAVPRYYVAFTTVRFNAEHLLSEQMRALSDPLEELLASANQLIPAHVPEVLRELGWQEALVDDPDARAAFIDEVTDRVTVDDIGTGPRRGRSNTTLRITYRDTDGRRAADFANALRVAWTEGQLEQLKEIQNKSRRLVQEQQVGIQEEVDQIRREIALFEMLHGLDPAVRDSNLLLVDRSMQATLGEDYRTLSTRQLELDEVEIQIERLKQRLEGDLIPRLIEAPPPVLDPILQQQLLELNARVQYLERTRRLFRPGTESRAFYDAELERRKEELKTKQPVPSTSMVPNPAYVELQRELEALETRRSVLKGNIDGLQERIEATEAKLRERPTIVQQYNRKHERFNAAQARLTAIEAELDRLTTLARRVESSDPYSTIREALTPRRATEPNIILLGLIGSLIGLGVAVGLILGLDAVRFTYKTIEDLERGLPVPVLGGVSHIETWDERTQVRRGRLLVSIMAAALLFLIVAVATIYYVAPARLPTWARDVLDMVLGSGE